MSWRCWRSKRLETPLRLFASEETATLGGILHEQVHVVVFAVHLHPRGVRVRADVGEDAAQEVDSLCVETHGGDTLLRRQMRMNVENTFWDV